jgi:D-alanyl-D-alanine carboxypeptidase
LTTWARTKANVAPHVAAVSWTYNIQTTVRSGENSTSLQVQGVTANYADVNNWHPASGGTFITQNDVDSSARVALIDSTTASDANAVSGASAESTSEVTTCTITPIYNLNLRDQPNTDGKIYLSIPYGTQITTDGRTADDWYKVTYNGQAGWVSGEYASKVAACSALAIVEASS